jgi:heat-inducible transcriptional repressor
MLDERKAAILKAVIEEYIDTAQPVGSSAVVAAADVKVSAATIRNDMLAALEETDGYLTQPHVSAGRVPTEKGYRHFVENLHDARLPGLGRRKVAAFFGQLRGEIEGVMRETAGLLTNMTDYAAVIVDDSDEAAVVRSVQLVGLTDRVALAVVVLANGQVLKRTIDFASDVSDAELADTNLQLRAALEERPLHP